MVKQFVVDYNTETFEHLMEHEVNGLDYKYVYGNDRLSVDISPINNSMSIVENGDHIRLYYHMDYLGTTDYLTSPVSLKVESWTHYNEWGEIVHNAVLNCGQRELDLVKRYATHDYDSVLELYYAKARFYDADNRRFTAMDPILDPSQYDIREYVDDPMQLVQYLYVSNDPLVYIDSLGLFLQGTIMLENAKGKDVALLMKALYAWEMQEPSAEKHIQKYFTSNQFQYPFANRDTLIEKLADNPGITREVVQSIIQFQKANASVITDDYGTVGISTWEALGLSVNSTIAEEFFSGTRGNDLISVTIQDNTITIDYFPKIYACMETVTTAIEPFTGYEYDISTRVDVSTTTYEHLQKQIIAGLKMWETSNGQHSVQGVPIDVVVNVTPTRVYTASEANISIVSAEEGGSIVLAAMYWDYKNYNNISITKNATVNTDQKLQLLVAHEFGHVLGLFDAYGYENHFWGGDIVLPEARPSRAQPTTNVMASQWWGSGYIWTDTEYEMLLYAWTHNKLQLYEKSALTVLGAEESQAFFN